MLRLSCLLMSFLLIACSPGEQSDGSSQLEARIDNIENGLISSLQIKGQTQEQYNINERLEELGIPGLSVAFSSNGEVEWTRAYGLADTTENRPMTTREPLIYSKNGYNTDHHLKLHGDHRDASTNAGRQWIRTIS